jgi:hypothetical protein
MLKDPLTAPDINEPNRDIYKDKCVEYIRAVVESIGPHKLPHNPVAEAITLGRWLGEWDEHHKKQMEVPVSEETKYWDTDSAPQTITAVTTQDLALERSERDSRALAALAESITSLTQFITTGGLANLLSGYARTNGVNGMLQGLAQHSGRGSLDARTIQQNATEIVTQVEAVFDKYAERTLDKKDRNPDIQNGEEDFKAWVEKKKKEG